MISISPRPTNVTNSTSTTAAFKALSKGFEETDILVSDAGFLASPSAIAQSDEDEWWRGFEINICESFNAIRIHLPTASKKAMLFSINTGITSLSAILGFSSYVARKVTAAKMFEYLQAENPGLHVVNVHPEVVDADTGQKSSVRLVDDGESMNSQQ